MAGAMAMGTMKKIASVFHWGKVKSGMASHLAALTASKLTIPVAREAMYPAKIPQRMGMSFRRPRPRRLTRTVTEREIMETMIALFWGTRTNPPSPLLPMAMFTATGARIRPMTMITGPVTTGGKILRITSDPFTRMMKLRII